MANLVEKAPFKVGDIITIGEITGTVLMFHELGKGLRVSLDVNLGTKEEESCFCYLYEKDFKDIIVKE